MTEIRVLIADDEIPYGDHRDQRTREAFRRTRPNASEEEYRRGYDGMRGAVDALKKAEFDLTVRQRFNDAKEAIRTAKKPFDVAIIDLAWAAEPDLEDYDNAGKRLVKALGEAEGGGATRVIMYSSRFEEDAVLAENMRKLGTLPLPKTYTEGSHQTLVAAVRFLADRKPTSVEQAMSKSIETWAERLAALRMWDWWARSLFIFVALVVIAGVATTLFVGSVEVAKLQAACSVLVVTLLGAVNMQVRSLVKDVQRAMDRIQIQARESRAGAASA